MIGIGVYDFIIKDQYDSELGETYRALSCCNDSEMASRCKVKDAKKVVWSIKANAAFNTEMCLALRRGFQNGRINLLVSEFVAEENLKTSYKAYTKLSPKEQSEYKKPYVQTSFLINELINLEHTVNGTNIKLTEKTGMRKDRYSSLGYNYWVVGQIEKKTKPKKDSFDLVSSLTIRPAQRRSTIWD